MYRGLVFLIAISLGGRLTLVAQDQRQPSKNIQYAGLYGSVLYHSTTDFPVTQNASMFSGEPSAFKSNASSGGIALGYFTTMFSTRQGYAGLELAFSWSSFSDANVSNKSFYFFDLFLHLGVSPWDDARFALYGIFGGGLLYHSEDEDLNGPVPAAGPSVSFPPDYYLAKYVGAVVFGFGVRVKPLSRVVLSCEYKWVYDSSSELNMNRPVAGEPDWYYTKSNFDPIGNRLSVGISYVFTLLE